MHLNREGDVIRISHSQGMTLQMGERIDLTSYSIYTKSNNVCKLRDRAQNQIFNTPGGGMHAQIVKIVNNKKLIANTPTNTHSHMGTHTSPPSRYFWLQLCITYQRISESMIMIDKANMYMIISWQGIIYLDHMHATFIYHYHTLTNSLMQFVGPSGR